MIRRIKSSLKDFLKYFSLEFTIYIKCIRVTLFITQTGI